MKVERAKGAERDRVGPNKIADETWGRSVMLVKTIPESVNF